MFDPHKTTGPIGPVFFAPVFASLRRAAGALAGAAMIAAAPPAGAADAVPAPQSVPLPQMRLSVGGHPVQAEVAATEASLSLGLMYRKSLAPDHGMLFVFEQPGPFCFWMKNTLVPLSIAFIASNGTIVNIADMQPRTETPHCPARPVLYALEMQQGWFARHRVHAGQKVADLPRPRP